MIFVDDAGKLHDPVESEAMSQPRCSMPPRSAPFPDGSPRGELHDHARAVLAKSGEQPGEAVRIRCGGLIIVPDMHMGDRCAASKAAWVDSTCSAMVMGTARIVLLARNGAGDRDGDDAGVVMASLRGPMADLSSTFGCPGRNQPCTCCVAGEFAP